MENRIGKTKTMVSGQQGTIVKYNSKDDIDVLLEEGVVVCNKRYADFANGNIRVLLEDKTYIPSKRPVENRLYLGLINMSI